MRVSSRTPSARKPSAYSCTTAASSTRSSRYLRSAGGAAAAAAVVVFGASAGGGDPLPHAVVSAAAVTKTIPFLRFLPGRVSPGPPDGFRGAPRGGRDPPPAK